MIEIYLVTKLEEDVKFGFFLNFFILKLEKVVGGFCVVVVVILFRLVQILAQTNPLITSFVLRVETPLWDEKCLSYNSLMEIGKMSKSIIGTKY